VLGGEELSLRAPAVADRTPAPYLGLGPADAGALGVAEGQGVAALLEDRRLDLPVRLRPQLAPGTATLPAGLPGLEGLALPAWCRLVPGEGGSRG
jgi:NADH-quinone oxidoreductase subunit G